MKKYKVLESKMAQLNEAYQKEKKELASAVKQELEKEKNKTKFELELDFNTRTQNLENELRRSMTAVREEEGTMKDKDHEIEKLRKQLEATRAKKQRAVEGLKTTQMQVRQLKGQYDQMRASLTTELVWGRIGPKPPVIKAVVEKIQHVRNLEQAHQA